MATDEALMAAYVRGDEAAFDELFRRYAPLLTRVLRGRLGSDVDAQDLVQQTFLQLHRARLDYRAEMPFRPWLFTIAFNLQRETFRRARARRSAQTEPLGVDDRVAADAGPDALEVQEVQRALARLPAETREVITLHWFEGLSFSEVAVLVGASLSAVKVRAHRGYVMLKGYLASDR